MDLQSTHCKGKPRAPFFYGRTIYWTGMHWIAVYGNSIWRAGMDGSNAIGIVPGRYEPWGCITIDYMDYRLYCTGVRLLKVTSSDLKAEDIQTIVDFPVSPELFLLAIY